MKWTNLVLTSVLILVSFGAVYWYQDIVGPLQEQFLGAGVYAEVAFVLLLALAVVLMPLTVLPLIPVAVATFGAFATSLLSILGWTLGGTIAFVLSRYVGGPLVQRSQTLQKVEQIVSGLSQQRQFWYMVLLRMTLPVDVLSYAFGLIQSIRFSTYVASTALGVAFFSFLFAYLGDALYQKNVLLLIELGALGAGVFIVAGYLVKREREKHK